MRLLMGRILAGWWCHDPPPLYLICPDLRHAPRAEREVFEMTTDDYLAILSVVLPMVVMAIVVIVIVMKQEWKNNER